MEQLELEDGLRLTDVAARAGMTAQSMGELVDDLETKGYVARQPDPGDRRAKRIYLTERGRHNGRVAKSIIVDRERELAQRLGPEQYHLLRQTLKDIITAEGGDDGRR